MKKSLSELSTEELETKLKAAKQIHVAVLVIFALILVAWFVTGYWKTNVPVFVSTVALALGAMVVTRIPSIQLQAELTGRAGKQ